MKQKALTPCKHNEYARTVRQNTDLRSAAVREFHDEVNRRAHNACVDLKQANNDLGRARRSVESLRCALTEERARSERSAATIRGLIGLLDSASERGLSMSPGFIELHLKAALRDLGREP